MAFSGYHFLFLSMLVVLVLGSTNEDPYGGKLFDHRILVVISLYVITSVYQLYAHHSTHKKLSLFNCLYLFLTK